MGPILPWDPLCHGSLWNEVAAEWVLRLPFKSSGRVAGPFTPLSLGARGLALRLWGAGLSNEGALPCAVGSQKHVVL